MRMVGGLVLHQGLEPSDCILYIIKKVTALSQRIAVTFCNLLNLTNQLHVVPYLYL